MKEIQLIIFDCDGVLVDSEALSNGVVAEMLSLQGLPMSAEEGVRYFAGTSMKYIQEYYHRQMGVHLPDDFEQRYRKRSFEVFEERLEAVPGIREALEAIQLPRCVASNGPINKIEFNLKVTNLQHFFGDHIFSAYQIKKWKPLPDLYLHAAKQMGYEAQRCLVIEDSVAGVQAAKAAGMRVIGYAAGHSTEQALSEAGAEVIYSMKNLPQKVLNI